MTPTTAPARMKAWLEQAWLVRYLDRELSSDETTWFESYAIDKPELLAAIAADTDLRDALHGDAQGRRGVREPAADYLRANRDTARAASMSPMEQPTPVNPVETSPRAPRVVHAPRWLGLAAALLVGVGAGWMATIVRAPREAAPAVVASPTRIVYDTMRGEAASPRIEHGDSRSPYVFVEVAVPPDAEHVVLRIGDLEEPLPPSPEGFVSFLAVRKKLVVKTLVSISYARRDHSEVTTLQLQPIDQ